MKLLILFLALCISFVSYAQVEVASNLYQQISRQDSIFFEMSFNRCNLEYLDNHITEDLKFYHDQGGFQNKEIFLQNIKNNICPDSNIKPIRKPVSGSFEVYPLYDNGELYAVIQKGEHQFYLREEAR